MTVTCSSTQTSLAKSLTYKWAVTGHHSTTEETVLPAEDSKIQYPFPTAGTYEITAKGYRASSYAEQKLLVTAQLTVVVRGMNGVCVNQL